MISRKSKIMTNGVLVFLVIGSIYFYFSRNPISESMDLGTEGIQLIQDAEESMLEEYDPDILKKDIERKKTPYEIVQFMFSTVLYQKPLLFSQNFNAEQFLEDIMQVQSIADKEIQGEDGELYLINRLSREGKLKEVKHIKTTENFFKGTAVVKVELIYNDKTVILPIELKNEKTGEKEKSSFYYISSSLWTLIRNIDK